MCLQKAKNLSQRNARSTELQSRDRIRGYFYTARIKLQKLSENLFFAAGVVSLGLIECLCSTDGKDAIGGWVIGRRAILMAGNQAREKGRVTWPQMLHSWAWSPSCITLLWPQCL